MDEVQVLLQMSLCCMWGKVNDAAVGVQCNTAMLILQYNTCANKILGTCGEQLFIMLQIFG